MKRIGISSLLTALLLGFGLSPAQATPMYYTFSGLVTEVSGQTDGLGIGSDVTYTFLVDTEGVGSYTFNGIPYTIDDYDIYNYFSAEYVSGSAIERPVIEAGQITNSLSHGIDYGNNYTKLSGSYTEFYYNVIEIIASPLISDWIVGTTTVVGYDRIHVNGSWPAATFVRSQLLLTDIAPANSVPEPSTMLLLGSGLLGLVGLNRRRKS